MINIKKFIFAVLLLAIGFSTATYIHFVHNIEELISYQEKKSNTLVHNSIEHLLEDEREIIDLRLKKFIENTNVSLYLENKNKKQLYEATLPFLDSLKEHYEIKKMRFILPNNNSFLRIDTYQEDNKNLTKHKPWITKINDNQETLYGFEYGKDGYSYKVAYPIIDQNKYLGILEIGIDIESIVHKIKHSINADVAIFIDEKAIKNDYSHKNYTQFETCVIVKNTNQTLVEAIIQDESFSLSDDDILFKIDKSFFEIDLIPLNDLNGEAYFVIIHDATKSNTQVQNTKNDFLILMLFMLFLVIVISYYIYTSLNKTITKQYSQLLEEKEYAEKLSKTKSEFLANMSHEIRTPLNAVLGFIELLEDESRGRKILKYIHIIKDSGQNLLQIIEDILDFSKIESGKIAIEKTNFNTKSELQVITYLFEAKCSQKDINLTLNIDENVPENIISDPLRIKQIISNLLSNAIKFTDNGKDIDVTIKYNNNKLHVNVKDEGIGIEKNKQQYIFEAFNQEDTSTTRKYGGTGLGLSISAELTKLLGGELKLKSKVGVGSEFYFSIPIEIGEKTKESDLSNTNITFNNKTILLVEDNISNQMFMKIVLKKLNFDFDVANDGLEAIEKFKKNKYDAILMDENMPNLNGIEATKRILQLEKEQNLKHTPIIALTANAQKGDRKRFMDIGMDEYITKPLDKNKLSQILNSFLS